MSKQLSTIPSTEFQEKFFNLYFSDSKKFKANVYECAKELKYPPQLISEILLSNWFLNGVAERRRNSILDLSEQTLQEILSTPFTVTKTTTTEDGEEVTETIVDKDIMKIRLDAAKFGSERLGKDKGYSQRIEKTENQTVNIFATLQRLNDPNAPLLQQPNIINIDNLQPPQDSSFNDASQITNDSF